MIPNELKTEHSVLVLNGLVFPDAGGTDIRIWKPATFTIVTPGTGYTSGSATCVLADGNSLDVTITAVAGEITAVEWVGGYSTSASDTSTRALVKVGGSSGEIAVATYDNDATPAMIDFGALWGRGYQYTLSLKTVTEHGTAPGGSKTVKVNRYNSDEEVAHSVAHTLLAARKTAGSALALTNAVDTTQYFEVASTFTPGARFVYLTFDVTALTSGASFEIELRLNRVV